MNSRTSSKVLHVVNFQVEGGRLDRDLHEGSLSAAARGRAGRLDVRVQALLSDLGLRFPSPHLIDFTEGGALPKFLHEGKREPPPDYQARDSDWWLTLPNSVRAGGSERVTWLLPCVCWPAGLGFTRQQSRSKIERIGKPPRGCSHRTQDSRERRVGFSVGFCRVSCREIGSTRQQLSS